MAGWLSRMFDRWAGNRQAQEMSDFVKSLRAMDADEIGMVVALATDQRNALESAGYRVSDPIIYNNQEPLFTFHMTRRVQRLQKENRLQEAAALMVWVHTMRAGSRAELRGLGREMWEQLARGFPYVEDQTNALEMLTGARPDVSEACKFPIGLAPEPSP